MTHFSTRHVELSCPHCAYTCDAAAHLSGTRGPRAGDMAFCVACGQWSIYTEERGRLGNRKPSDEELMEIHLNRKVHQIEAAWLAMNALKSERK